MSDRRIQCPMCGGDGNFHGDDLNGMVGIGCGACMGEGTIPDRRAPSAAERAVERIKAACDAINADVGGDSCNLSWECLDIIGECAGGCKPKDDGGGQVFPVEVLNGCLLAAGEGEKMLVDTIDALRAEVEALKAELDKCRKAYGKLFNESAALEGAAGDFDDLPMIAQMNKDAADEYRKQRDDACADVARLQAELAKYTGPLNNRQREAISRAMRVQNNPNMTKWDAAIRAAREGDGE